MLKHPVASNFLGRFGTMYNHVTAESRCPLGIAGPTKPTKPARRFFDASGPAQPSPAPDFSPDLHARARAIHPGNSERLRSLTSFDDPAGNHVGHFCIGPVAGTTVESIMGTPARACRRSNCGTL